MFNYFGRKARAAGSYPKPEYPMVIEPFAGSMAYTLRWRPPFAIGIEKDRRTYDLWHTLTAMSVDELRSYPIPEVGERTTDRWIIGAAPSSSNARSRYRTVSKFMFERAHQQRNVAIKHHAYAQRVLYTLGDYLDAPDFEATWFVDPPYQGVRQGYKHGPRDIDFDELAEWCMTRRGQVIICEGPSATWLPFEHHGSWQGTPNLGAKSKPIVEKVLTRRTHARCEECAINFPATRADARYCSGRCRQRASYRRRRQAQQADDQ